MQACFPFLTATQPVLSALLNWLKVFHDNAAPQPRTVTILETYTDLVLFFCVVVVFYGTPEIVSYSSPFLTVKYLRNSPECATMAGTVHTQPVFVCVNECVDALIYFCL